MLHNDKEGFDRFTPTNLDSTPPLAVVIVTYNSADVLPGLMDSLRSGLEGIEDYDVIVVDNDSGDRSVELALDHPILPRVIRMGRNAGYAAGINAALATIEPCTDVLILNPDMRLFPGAASCLTDPLNDPSVGVAVPQIVNEEGEICHSLRREPSMKTAWSEALLGAWIAARIGLGETVGDAALYRQGGKVEWATGTAVAVAARARLAVGNWDESFFLCNEEVDYLERVRRCGLSVVYVPQARAVHIGGEYRENPHLSALMTTNRIRYYRRHHGRLATILFRLSIMVGETMRAALGPEHRAALRAALFL